MHDRSLPAFFTLSLRERAGGRVTSGRAARAMSR
jgi:hypothetical protein